MQRSRLGGHVPTTAEVTNVAKLRITVEPNTPVGTQPQLRGWIAEFFDKRRHERAIHREGGVRSPPPAESWGFPPNFAAYSACNPTWASSSATRQTIESALGGTAPLPQHSAVTLAENECAAIPP